MKFSLAFLAVLALSGVGNINAGPVRASSELHAVLEEFLALVPKEKIVAIVFDYVENDPEVQHVMEYIVSDDFKHLVQKVESIEDVINFYNYLDEGGLDVYGLVNKLHEFLGLPPLVPNKPGMFARRTGGLSGLINDIMNVLPMDKIKALYHEKLETSQAFADLIHHLGSPKCQELVNKLRANEEFRKIVAFCHNAGIDVNAIKNLLSTIFGLQFPHYSRRVARGLQDDYNDFLNLLPQEQIVKIVLDYIENDPEMAQVLEYIQSQEFHETVDVFENMQEVRNFLAYLQESGFDVYELLKNIHGVLGLPDFKPFSIASRRTGGLVGLIEDIKAVLPLDKIKALYDEKLETSPEFAKLVKYLSSPLFQEYVDKILAKEEAKVIIQKLKDHGVDLQVIADLLTQLFGLHFPKPVLVARFESHLLTDLFDFIELLPLQAIKAIAETYVFADEDVQAAGAYLQSEEFRQLATKAEANDEFRIFIGYLENSGLPIVEFLNVINEFLDIPKVDPIDDVLRSAKGNGVREMLDAIEGLLPVDKIKALYHEKLETSEAFKFFVDRLSSSKFQDIVTNLAYNEDFQKLGYRAAEFGIDLDAIVDFMSKVFGIEFPHELLPGNKPESRFY